MGVGALAVGHGEWPLLGVREEDALLDRMTVQIPRSNLVSHKRSFVPSAARIWNSLPEYIPSLEKRACFKKEVNRYLGDN